ncbi:HARB1 nuclease, partial [Amia calva]|nr:HARB1 nuclease [Amia calva]
MAQALCVVAAGQAVMELLREEQAGPAWGLQGERELEALLEAALTQGARRGCRRPCHTDSLTGRQFKERFRLDRGTIQCVVEQLHSSELGGGRQKGRPPLSLRHCVLLCACLLGGPRSYRAAAAEFGLERGNAHRLFTLTCRRICVLTGQHITWATGAEVERNIQGFDSLDSEGGGGFPGVFGVLGATRIPVRGLSSKGERERGGREGEKSGGRSGVAPALESWLRVEVVCDFRGRFLYCGVSEGLAAAQRPGGFWECSDLGHRLREDPGAIPEDAHMLAGGGYPLCGQILTPFKGPLSPRQTRFNQRLAVRLAVLGRSLSELKARFRRLQYLDTVSLERARSTILSCCVLHNLSIQRGDSVPEEWEREREEEEGEEEVEGDGEEAGKRKREAIADLLYAESSTNTLTD